MDYRDERHFITFLIDEARLLSPAAPIIERPPSSQATYALVLDNATE